MIMGEFLPKLKVPTLDGKVIYMRLIGVKKGGQNVPPLNRN